MKILILFLVSSFYTHTVLAQQKPNIIFILADDLGYGDVGCYGQEKIKTPNIDQLAQEGIRFTDHYSGHTVCSPSRGSLMTGKHMGHASVTKNGQRLSEKDVTIAMRLKGAGYKTGMIGKWGLVGRPDHAGSPNKKGFDHFFGFDNQGFAHFYYPEYVWRNKEKVEYPKNNNLRVDGFYKKGEGAYIHYEFADEALSFIRENKDNPFFLYIPFAIPHAELTVPQDSMAPYLKLGWPETPKIAGKGNTGGGRNDAGYGSQYKEGYCGQKYPNASYAGMISRMDANIGRILELLDELKISENTLVVFSSDNGPSGEGGQDVDFFDSNGPLSAGKRSAFEGGIRIPFIARWPGKIAPGKVSNHLSAFWDFLPTACEIAGVKSPKDTDGISYLPEFLGQKQAKHDYMYWFWGKREVVRCGDWKLHRVNKSLYELYNLKSDIAEKKNLASTKPEIVSELKKFFKIAKK